MRSKKKHACAHSRIYSSKLHLVRIYEILCIRFDMGAWSAICASIAYPCCVRHACNCVCVVQRAWVCVSFQSHTHTHTNTHSVAHPLVLNSFPHTCTHTFCESIHPPTCINGTCTCTTHTRWWNAFSHSNAVLYVRFVYKMMLHITFESIWGCTPLKCIWVDCNTYAFFPLTSIFIALSPWNLHSSLFISVPLCFAHTFTQVLSSV